MIAVGIDVSKSKSTVAILNGDGSIRAKPFDVHHVAGELQALVDYIKRTSEPPTILMEPTSHYHYPLLKAFQEADLPVCLINPYQMKKVWRYRASESKDGQKRCFEDCSVCT